MKAIYIYIFMQMLHSIPFEYEFAQAYLQHQYNIYSILQKHLPLILLNLELLFKFLSIFAIILVE